MIAIQFNIVENKGGNMAASYEVSQLNGTEGELKTIIKMVEHMNKFALADLGASVLEADAESELFKHHKKKHNL